MRWKPTCLGYIRTDVSGMAQLWGQADFRRLADRLGYDFADCVIFDPKFGRPSSARLEAQATRLDAEAVKVPNVAHVEGGEIPSALMRQLDVITVNPEEMYVKRATSPLRDFSPIEADGAQLRDHFDAREPRGGGSRCSDLDQRKRCPMP